MSYFSDKIKSLRMNENLTQRQLCDIIGISQGTYSGIENGVREPSIGAIIGLADYYDVYVDSLVRPVKLDEGNGIPTEDRQILRKIKRLDKRDREELLMIIEMKNKKRREVLKFTELS